MNKTIERAQYGAAAFAGVTGKLPNKFPRRIGPSAMKYLQEVVDSGLTVDMIGRFEKAFAEAMGVKHCIAAPGCTNALMLLAEAMCFEPGDEVICSSLTDFGTIMGIVKRNLIPIFADTDPDSSVISASTINPCITDRTRAIICVHKTGTMCDMDPIMELAASRGLLVIEDVCQAVYGRYKGRLAGTIGHVGAFSFDSEKTMGSDVGGCLILNDDGLANHARFIGQSRGAQNKPGFGRVHTAAGQALRMPHCTAAICLAQLEIIQDQVQHIDRIIRALTERLAEIPGILPLPIPRYMDVYSCWMAGFMIDRSMFCIDADAFGQQCAEAGLNGASTAPYYLMPAACVFLQDNATRRQYPYSMPPASRTYAYSAESCPNALDFVGKWIRWTTFSEKYQPEHVELCVKITRGVAERNRR